MITRIYRIIASRGKDGLKERGRQESLPGQRSGAPFSVVLLGALLVLPASALGASLKTEKKPAAQNSGMPDGEADLLPKTLAQAMETAYLTNPTLREERARLRAVDETLPQAMGGWRPTINGTLNLTYYQGSSNYQYDQTYDTPQGKIEGAQTNTSQTYATPGYNGGVTINQPLFQGGKTVAGIRMAKNQILAARAHLIAVEQQVFLQVVNAYVGVVQTRKLLDIAKNNEFLLRKQVEATNKRFHIGTLTRTDVAQAQGALASATSMVNQARSNVQTAEATYRQVVGMAAATKLASPQPLVAPVKTDQEAILLAVRNNPNVINALFTEAQQKNNISAQWAALLPKVGATFAYQHSVNQGYGGSSSDNKYGMIGFSFPIYQGGGEYAAIRQARQNAEGAKHEIDVQKRSAIQLATATWQEMAAARESINSNRIAVAANIAALAGIEKQAVLGTATTLSVLQQQQILLQSQQTLVQNIGSLVASSYAVAAALGRLTATDLKLSVPLYNEKAYYNEVKNRLWGTGDYVRREPGR